MTMNRNQKRAVLYAAVEKAVAEVGHPDQDLTGEESEQRDAAILEVTNGIMDRFSIDTDPDHVEPEPEPEVVEP